MKYALIWMPDAIQALAAVWLAAADRNAVTAAVNVIDRTLANSPNAIGVVLFDTVREHAIPPLGFEFEVDDATRQVFVLNVWDAVTGRPNPTGN